MTYLAWRSAATGSAATVPVVTSPTSAMPAVFAGLAAGAVLGEGKSVPAGHLAAGVPATVRKPLDGSSQSWVGTAAKHYQDRAVRYRANLRPNRS